MRCWRELTADQLMRILAEDAKPTVGVMETGTAWALGTIGTIGGHQPMEADLPVDPHAGAAHAFVAMDARADGVSLRP